MTTKDQRLEELDGQNLRAWMLLTEILDCGAPKAEEADWHSRARQLVGEMNELYVDVDQCPDA